MSRYEKLSPVRLPSGHGTIKAVVVWSEPKLCESEDQGRVRAEAIVTPSGGTVTKTWGEDSAEYVTQLALRSLRNGGVDSEIVNKLLSLYSKEVRVTFHVQASERVFSDAMTLKFWLTDDGTIDCLATVSASFPRDLLPLARRMGQVTVDMQEKNI